MNPKMSIRNAERNCEDFREVYESLKQCEHLETCWQLPQEIGRGSIRKTRFRHGFDFYIMDCKYREHISFSIEGSLSIFGFSFYISGRINTAVSYLQDNFTIHGGQNCLSYFPEQRCIGEANEKEDLIVVEIQMDPQVFNNIMAEDFDSISTDFQNIADGSKVKSFLRIDATTPLMDAALYQIINCQYQGLTRRLYIESRALELIAYKLEQLISNDYKKREKFVLRPSDIEKVHYARDLAVRDLENPPRLLDIARSVGLSHTKLNFGFRKIYGTTIFDYVRYMRLKRAKLLLDESEMNVTEAAFSVGYSCLSYFTKAFREQFGIAPGKYLREAYKQHG